MKISNITNNDYANCMFRFENLNDSWIKLCAAYLKHLFGDSIKGKTVIDYAFGRGNWSIAFLKMGAKNIIAIDASMDNVKRFSSYCKSNNIDNISIIHGNILERDLDFKCDLLWLYGILPCIPQLEAPNGFLRKIKLLLKKDALVYAYFYNKNSLRCPIVELCRKLHVYKNEQEFLDDHYLFLRSAKNRASDDLVAPYIKWWTASDAQDILKKNGIYVKRQDIDFFEFCNKIKNPEFYPHQFLCGLQKNSTIFLKERPYKYQEEIKIILLLGDEIIKAFKQTNIRKKISIGIFNTYFSQLENKLDIKDAIIEVYLYLIRILMYKNNIIKNNNTLIVNYFELTEESLKDKAHRNRYYRILGKNIISQYLIENRIRI